MFPSKVRLSTCALNPTGASIQKIPIFKFPFLPEQQFISTLGNTVLYITQNKWTNSLLTQHLSPVTTVSFSVLLCCSTSSKRMLYSCSLSFSSIEMCWIQARSLSLSCSRKKPSDLHYANLITSFTLLFIQYIICI